MCLLAHPYPPQPGAGRLRRGWRGNRCSGRAIQRWRAAGTGATWAMIRFVRTQRSRDAAASSASPRRPVFIDDTGRRARALVLLSRGIVGLCLAYVGLVAASLLGAPWVPHEVLPSVGPVPHAQTAVTLPSTAARQPTPSLPSGHATTTVHVTSTTAAKPTSTVTSSPRPSSTTVPGRAPVTTTTTAASSGSTTTPPSPSATAPGRTRRG